MSDTLVTSEASIPYELRIVVRISSASPASANPAFASLVEFSTKLTASPVDCPAEIALYTFSAISVEAMPLVFESSNIDFSRSSIGTCVVSAIVLTFAIASSKSIAILPVETATPPIAAVAGMNFLPIPDTAEPALSNLPPMFSAC